MKHLSVVCALILSIASPQKRQLPNAIGSLASNVIDGFANLVTHGGKVWEELGKGQANAILDRVSDETVKLEADKNALRAYMVKNKDDKSDAASIEVSERCDKIKHDSQDIQTSLLEFGEEIDKAAHPVGEDMRAAVIKAETMKMAEIDAVDDLWDDHHPAVAVRYLDSAIQYLQLMRKGILCMQNSIKAEKAACD